VTVLAPETSHTVVRPPLQTARAQTSGRNRAHPGQVVGRRARRADLERAISCPDMPGTVETGEHSRASSHGPDGPMRVERHGRKKFPGSRQLVPNAASTVEEWCLTESVQRQVSQQVLSQRRTSVPSTRRSIPLLRRPVSPGIRVMDVVERANHRAWGDSRHG